MHKDPIAYLLVPADRPEDLAKCSISYQLLTELHRSRYEKIPIKIDFHKGNLTTKVFFPDHKYLWGGKYKGKIFPSQQELEYTSLRSAVS